MESLCFDVDTAGGAMPPNLKTSLPMQKARPVAAAAAVLVVISPHPAAGRIKSLVHIAKMFYCYCYYDEEPLFRQLCTCICTRGRLGDVADCTFRKIFHGPVNIHVNVLDTKAMRVSEERE